MSALAAALVLLAWSPALAGAPTDRLREFFARVNAILADPATEDRPLERVARVRRLVADTADVNAAASAALGPEWETKTTAEREEFATLFADVLERAYIARLAGAVRATGEVEMSYRGEVRAGDEVTVRTALRGHGGHDVRVEYRMALRGGRWRVHDIVVDGVSTVENYRAQFRRILQHGSYVALVAQMREKLTAESLMFARMERGQVVAASPPPETRAVVMAPRGVDEKPTIASPIPPAPAPLRAAAPPVVRPPGVERVTRTEPPRAVAVAKAAPPRAVDIAKSAPPRVVAVAKSAVAVQAAPPVPAMPVATSAGTVSEANPVGMALGALLLALLGAGGTTVLRRRATSHLRRRTPSKR